MENIQVALRFRPLSSQEKAQSDQTIWRTHGDNSVQLRENTESISPIKKLNISSRPTFTFDKIFTGDDCNLHVYNSVMKSIALSSLEGINGSIFMYGPTGSGKTYTMMGYNKYGEEFEGSSRNESPSAHDRSKSWDFSLKRSGNKAGNGREYTNKGDYIISDTNGTAGTLVLAMKNIFQKIREDTEKTYFLSCSYIEIYNDNIYDLLRTPEQMSETLTVNEDSAKEFYIKGVKMEAVSCVEDVLELLQRGESNRHYACTAMNHMSSRSHTIFRLKVQSVTNRFIRDYLRENHQNTTNINIKDIQNKFRNVNLCGIQHSEGDEGIFDDLTVTESLLNFVDLAGSEKISSIQPGPSEEGTPTNRNHSMIKDDLIETKSRGIQKEGLYINKSLFFLTQVISLKSEGKSNAHIPYRNSPLTKILRSSLGGNSRTLIVLCASPGDSQYEQTLSTMRFGLNAKKIENKIQVNRYTGNHREVLKVIISDYETKIKELESQRKEMSKKNSFLQKENVDLRRQRDLLSERLNEALRNKLISLNEQFHKDENESFRRDIAELNFSIKCASSIEKKTVTKRGRADLSLNSYAEAYYMKEGFTQESQSITRTSAKGKNDVLLRSYRRIIESESEFAMKSNKILQHQNAILQRKIDLLNENFQQVLIRLEETTKPSAKFQEKFALYEEKVKVLVELYQREVDDRTKIQAELELYRDLKGVNELPLEKIESLEKTFLHNYDAAKTVYLQKLNGENLRALKVKYGIKEVEQSLPEHNIHRKIEENGSASKGLAFDLQGLKELSKILQEREVIDGKEIAALFDRGIETLNVELEETNNKLKEAEKALGKTLLDQIKSVKGNSSPHKKASVSPARVIDSPESKQTLPNLSEQKISIENEKKESPIKFKVDAVDAPHMSSRQSFQISKELLKKNFASNIGAPNDFTEAEGTLSPDFNLSLKEEDFEEKPQILGRAYEKFEAREPMPKFEESSILHVSSCNEDFVKRENISYEKSHFNRNYAKSSDTPYERAPQENLIQLHRVELPTTDTSEARVNHRDDSSLSQRKSPMRSEVNGYAKALTPKNQQRTPQNDTVKRNSLSPHQKTPTTHKPLTLSQRSISPRPSASPKVASQSNLSKSANKLEGKARSCLINSLVSPHRRKQVGGFDYFAKSAGQETRSPLQEKKNQNEPLPLTPSSRVISTSRDDRTSTEVSNARAITEPCCEKSTPRRAMLSPRDALRNAYLTAREDENAPLSTASTKNIDLSEVDHSIARVLENLDQIRSYNRSKDRTKRTSESPNKLRMKFLLMKSFNETKKKMIFQDPNDNCNSTNTDLSESNIIHERKKERRRRSERKKANNETQKSISYV